MLDMKFLLVFNIFRICKYSYINSPTVYITKDGDEANIAYLYAFGTTFLATPLNAIR